MVIILRLVWVFPGAVMSTWIRTRILHQNEKLPSARAILVTGWTGMRGVISLAAAIALPETLANGNPFPNRDLIIFLAFTVIFVTLVLQGLTLPFVVRKLGLAGTGGSKSEMEEEEESARREMLQSALAYLEEARKEDEGEFHEIYEDLSGHYRHRLAAVNGVDDADSQLSPQHRNRHSRLLRELLQVERQTALRLRGQGRINDETLRQLEYELDLREANPSMNA
jgi:CPA1 family monovalent cation:H+ antiporter